MQVNAYVGVIFFMGICFFLAVILALYWAVKTGQFSKFEDAARSIFTEDEPEGSQTDFFPQEKAKALDNLAKSNQNSS